MSGVITVGSVENDVTTGAENALTGLLLAIRKVAGRVPWTEEKHLHEVLDAIESYEKHALGILKYEASRLSFHPAGREDVSTRVPAAPPSGQVTAQIDYTELAKAMLALQAAQNPPAQAAIEPTSVVTGADQQAGGVL